MLEDLKQDIAALKNSENSNTVDALVKTGLDDGRLLPAQECWARELGQSNIAALKSYLDTTPAIAALKGQQTQRISPKADKPEDLDPEAVAVCKAMGILPRTGCGQPCGGFRCRKRRRYAGRGVDCAEVNECKLTAYRLSNNPVGQGKPVISDSRRHEILEGPFKTHHR